MRQESEDTATQQVISQLHFIREEIYTAACALLHTFYGLNSTPDQTEKSILVDRMAATICAVQAGALQLGISEQLAEYMMKIGGKK